MLKNTDEVLIVANPTLSSVMDALKTIELAKANDNMITGVILNMTHGGRHELKQSKVEEILGYPVIANIKRDTKIRKALHKQMPLNHVYKWSRSARQYTKVAQHITMQDVA
ncbi:MAG TPA: AAA family ATPase [Candidatus Nanoarchaeia archaeon]|nr:AAA family ATPase [Candidatus Nanoarchaeia archaeon]